MSDTHCPETAVIPDTPRRGELRCTLPSSLAAVSAEVSVRYTLRGDLGKPCLAVLGGISANADPGQWWADQVGPGRALDSDRYLILGIDYLNRLPQGFSAVTPEDQASALRAVLDALGITRLHAFVGASYGGAVALAFAQRWPERLAAALVVSMAHRPSPMASALRSVQRELLRLGAEHGCPERSVALARGLAITSYRSEAEFAARFDAPAQFRDGRWRLPVESYLEAQGARFAQRFDAEQYCLLSESLDLHRVEAGQISTPLYLLAVEEDRLVPHGDMADLARDCDCGTLQVLSSHYGHDAFLTEPAAVSRWLVDSLEDLRRMPGSLPDREVANPSRCRPINSFSARCAVNPRKQTIRNVS